MHPILHYLLTVVLSIIIAEILSRVVFKQSLYTFKPGTPLKHKAIAYAIYLAAITPTWYVFRYVLE